MKIVFLITRMDEYGGAQVHVRDLVMWLRKEGHDPLVFSGLPGKVSDYIERRGITYIEVPDLVRSIRPVADFKAFLQIRRHLKRVKPDIVACHSAKAGVLGRLACALLDIPVVFTAHGWAFSKNIPQPHRTIYTIIEKVGGWFDSHVITVSKFDRDFAIKNNIVRPMKLTAIHNGMPEMPYEAIENNDLEENVRLIMVARFSAQKDHGTLIRALAKIKDMHWTLDLVGCGDNSECGKLVDAVGLSDKVNFLGERDDIPTCLANSDVFCLMSNWEGFPLSILEAMRAGLPVIVTDVGGVRETIIEGETGYCPPHKDIDALANNLKTLIENPQTIKAMGLAGRRRFEAHFTLDKMAIKTMDIYEGMLSKHKNMLSKYKKKGYAPVSPLE